MTKPIIPQPESRFIRLRCEKCKNEQIIFSKPSSEIRCLVCGAMLAKPTGGIGRVVDSKIVEVLE